MALSEDEQVVKAVWKSAHAVNDWPGKWTIRRFRPYKKVKVEGEGKTAAEAWKHVADKIRAIWAALHARERDDGVVGRGEMAIDRNDQGWAGFREGIDYPGRPDLGTNKIVDWGIVKAKRFLPYVHSTAGNALLIHKVASVEIRWYQSYWNYMKRREQPSLHALTVCGMWKALSRKKGAAKMCEIPDPRSVLCGKCHGELATFSRKRTVRVTKRWAKDHLGCKGAHVVIDPYQPPNARILE